MMTENEIKPGGPRVVLASASPRRRELLTQIGIVPQIIPSTVEEHVTSTSPSDVVKELSRQKARDVAAKLREEHEADCRDSFVIGADTIVSIDGRILGKPATHDDAYDMIAEIQGKTHEVFTGVTIIRMRDGHEVTFAECTAVHAFPMTEEEIRAYTALEEPMDKAGAYGIQGSFAAYISGIDGDYNNVVGLPVGRLYQTLKEMM